MKCLIIEVPKKGKDLVNLQIYLFENGCYWKYEETQIKEEIKDYSFDDNIRLIVNKNKEISWARKKENISIDYIDFKKISYKELIG